MTSALPPSLRLAWWGTAWLRGHVVTDLVVDAVLADDATHAVAGLPGTDRTETLVVALGRLRAAGVSGLGAAFPTEGDPVGLGGPAAFNADALEAGEAVVAAEAGLGLVPHRTGAAVTWTTYAASRRQLPDVGEADRQLRSALVESANSLARLDVARWRPDVADELLNLRHRAGILAPAGVPERCVDLAGRGLQAMGIVELALEDDGGAVSASEILAREAALRPLARAGRRALVAACSPEVWPPD
ncbi:hypothetical protein [Nocardioides sp. URHA0020]|uniref:hypothetical protein n=1 Tax=Nocardioides sp. URHA0020 TaxID=1380392 RepID=UPI00048D9687|nr:hypothetical protein [Nocardioides sp. URHA0020]